jgi:hypothetical protein
MPEVDVIVGAYFGDEGKSKLVGAIGHRYGAVLRVNASTNAGHCVNDGERTLVTRQPTWSRNQYDNALLPRSDPPTYRDRVIFRRIATASRFGHYATGTWGRMVLGRTNPFGSSTFLGAGAPARGTSLVPSTEQEFFSSA